MGRIVNIASTGKERNQMRRTIAELLRRLSQKQGVDDEVKDMVAMIVFCLQSIDEGIDSSARAWEKRDYWMKAEGFRTEWRWVTQLEGNLRAMIEKDNWEELPQMMIELFPRFADIKVSKLTRDPEVWNGAYDKLMEEIES